MPSQWLAVGVQTDPLTRVRQLQTSWEWRGTVRGAERGWVLSPNQVDL